MPLRIAWSTPSGDVPTISVTLYVRSVMSSPLWLGPVVPSPIMPGRRVSVGEQWHLKALIPPEEHRPGNRSRSEPIAQVVDCPVEGGARASIERKRQLDGVVVGEIGESHSHEREAVTVDQRRGCGH